MDHGISTQPLILNQREAESIEVINSSIDETSTLQQLQPLENSVTSQLMPQHLPMSETGHHQALDLKLLMAQYPELAQNIVFKTTSLHLNQPTEGGISEALNNAQSLLSTLVAFYERELPVESDDAFPPMRDYVLKIQRHVSQLSTLVNTTNKQLAFNEVLSTVSNIMNTEKLLDNMDRVGSLDEQDSILAQDILPAQWTDRKKDFLIAKEKAMLTLSVAENMLPELYEVEAGDARQLSIQASALEQVINLKSALGDENGLFEHYLPEMNRVLDAITIPNLNQPPQEPNIEPLDNHVQVIPVESNRKTVNLAQTKMRTLTSAAFALLKFGKENVHRQEAMNKLEEAKTLYKQSRAAAYNPDPGRIDSSVFLGFANNQELILSKMLVVQTLAGEGDEALTFLKDEVVDLQCYLKNLLQFSKGLSETSAFSDKNRLANFFLKPILELIERIKESEVSHESTFSLKEQTDLLTDSASALYKMGAVEQSEEVYRNIISTVLGAINQMQTEDSDRVITLESINSLGAAGLISNLQSHQAQALIRSLIDESSVVAKPYLASYAMLKAYEGDFSYNEKTNAIEASSPLTESAITLRKITLEAANAVIKLVKEGDPSISKRQGKKILKHLVEKSQLYRALFTKEQKQSLKAAWKALS